jgi:hypothetical protein
MVQTTDPMIAIQTMSRPALLDRVVDQLKAKTLGIKDTTTLRFVGDSG